MASGNSEQGVMDAVDASQAAVAGALLAITRLFVDKGLITEDELRRAFDELKRPAFNSRAETQYQQIASALVTGRAE